MKQFWEGIEVTRKLMKNDGHFPWKEYASWRAPNGTFQSIEASFDTPAECNDSIESTLKRIFEK